MVVVVVEVEVVAGAGAVMAVMPGVVRAGAGVVRAAVGGEVSPWLVIVDAYKGQDTGVPASCWLAEQGTTTVGTQATGTRRLAAGVPGFAVAVAVTVAEAVTGGDVSRHSAGQAVAG